MMDFVVVWLKPSHRIALVSLSLLCKGFVVSCGQGWDSGASFILGKAQTMQALLGGEWLLLDRACLAPWEEAWAAQPAWSQHLAHSPSFEARKKWDIGSHGNGLWGFL